MGEGAEEQHRTADSTQHQKAAKFSVSPAQEERESGGGDRQTVEGIEQTGQAGQSPSERAQ